MTRTITNLKIKDSRNEIIANTTSRSKWIFIIELENEMFGLVETLSNVVCLKSSRFS